MHLDQEIKRLALKNAISHEGKCEAGSIINKLIGLDPNLKTKIREIKPKIDEVVKQVNLLSIKEQKDWLNSEFPDETKNKRDNDEEKKLPDLKNVNGKVVMRMAPSPSGPLHIGHTRMCILNDEYVKRYGGELILRIEDTNPNNIFPGAYEMIPEDNKWLGVEFTKLYIQSERFQYYYDVARELLRMGNAYICTCVADEFKEKLARSEACVHRDTNPEENLEKFEMILSGKFKEKSAVMMIKTDLKDPNPALRDWVAFRIIEKPHPHTGKKYRFYPLMNFSVACDDHDMELTHVIRGSDHLNNTYRQKWIFNYLGWKIPEYFHYGRINIGNAVLSTTQMRKGIENGTYDGWDDIRIATVRSFARRGYRPETFRRYWIMSGLNDVNSEFSWEIFNSINRQIIDPYSDRYFFIPEPQIIKIENSPLTVSKIPKYPNNPSRGYREYEVKENATLMIDKKDIQNITDGEIIRLKDLYNIQYKDGGFLYHSTEVIDRKKKIIQWLLPEKSSPFSVQKPDGNWDKGLAETYTLSASGTIQFERYGFVNKIDESSALYLHR